MKIAGIVCIGLIVIGLAIAVHAYMTVVYPIDRAIGYLNQAQTAGSPSTMANYMEQARDIIEERQGNPCWILPTESTNWDIIKANLEECIQYARSMASSDFNGDLQQGMDDIRGKLRVFCEQMNNAALWSYVSPINILLAIMWCFFILVSACYWAA